MLAIAGAADTFTVVFRSTIVQAETTEALRGRLTTAEYVMSVGGDSLGRLESGAVGSLTSPVVAALSGGLATVVLAGVIGIALPGFARYRAGSGPAPSLETLGPETLNPQTLDPQTLDPQTLDPQTLDPQTLDPQTPESPSLDLAAENEEQAAGAG
jgi:hypothetical protein